ncbi:hypothetical protein [Kitasatospora sp. MBT63]|uniref:hypothetical protein n=1 Tax=Kitasatospora sp. MBT63 TaxID=1444768 RepID=UPI001E34A763|nr:hypothetical protein [Kitasatospora sp. MBT63]
MQLGHRLSPKRRSAASRLRRLADPAAGPALLEALQTEVRDARTWETQYQMVMALGTCGHRPALGLLRDLARRPFEATAVYVALGDAIVRLSTPEEAAASLRGAWTPARRCSSTALCVPWPCSDSPWTRPRSTTFSTSSVPWTPTTACGSGLRPPPRDGRGLGSATSSGSAQTAPGLTWPMQPPRPCRASTGPTRPCSDLPGRQAARSDARGGATVVISAAAMAPTAGGAGGEGVKRASRTAGAA